MALEKRKNGHHPIIDQGLFYSPETQTALTNYQIAFYNLLIDRGFPNPAETLEHARQKVQEPVFAVDDSNGVDDSPPILSDDVHQAVARRIGLPQGPYKIVFTKDGVNIFQRNPNPTTHQFIGTRVEVGLTAIPSPKIVEGLATALRQAAKLHPHVPVSFVGTTPLRNTGILMGARKS